MSALLNRCCVVLSWLVLVCGTVAARAGSLTGSVVATPEPSVYGSPFTLTASFSIAAASALPTGSVAFFVDGTLLGSGVLAGGSASCGVTVTTPVSGPALAWFAVGTHGVTAVYSGDANYASVTLVGSHEVTGLPSHVVISNVQTPIYYGLDLDGDGEQTIDPYFAGATTTFFIDGVKVCVIAATGGTCPANVGVGYDAGAHTMQSVFSGDDEYAAGSSPVYAVQVLPDGTAVNAVVSSANPSASAQAVTFTAQVVAPYAMPRGMVVFLDGGVAVGAAALDAAGVASFTTAGLAAGSHRISASYGVTLDFAGSASGELVQVVDAAGPAGFGLQVALSSFSVGVGDGFSLPVTITPYGGFGQAVELSCGNLPAEVTCVFDQATIAPGGGTARMTITPAAPHDCGATSPYFVAAGRSSKMPWLALTVICLMAVRKRRLVRALMLGAMVFVLPVINGCSGTCTDFGVKPGGYSFVIRAVSSGGTVQSQKMQMSVHL